MSLRRPSFSMARAGPDADFGRESLGRAWADDGMATKGWRPGYSTGAPWSPARARNNFGTVHSVQACAHRNLPCLNEATPSPTSTSRCPVELIAQQPAAERSASRLLDGRGALPVDRLFRELPALLRRGDLLVFNDTRVIKARLFGEKPSGGAVQALVERVLPGFEVLAHLRASKSPRPGSRVRFANAFDAEVLGRAGADDALFHLRFPADPFALLQAHGHVPLPPYITHADTAEDEARYQTVFAARPGAVAAPTAALHFDAALLADTGRTRGRPAPR